MSRTNYLEKVAIVRFYSVPFEQMLAYTLLHVMGHNAGINHYGHYVLDSRLDIMRAGHSIRTEHGDCAFDIRNAFIGSSLEQLKSSGFWGELHKYFYQR